MNDGRKIRPKSQIMMPSSSNCTNPLLSSYHQQHQQHHQPPQQQQPYTRKLICDSLPTTRHYENEREIREKEIKELRQQISQMEKTMRWWSDCTTNWREKWSTVKNERNAVREELKMTRNQLENIQKEFDVRSSFDKEYLRKFCDGSPSPSQTQFNNYISDKNNVMMRSMQVSRKKTQTEPVTILDEETIANFEERISRLSFKLDESHSIIMSEREENRQLTSIIERLERNLYDLQELYDNLKKELYEVNGREYGESELDSFCCELEPMEESEDLNNSFPGKDNNTTAKSVEITLPVVVNMNLKNEVVFNSSIEIQTNGSCEERLGDHQKSVEVLLESEGPIDDNVHIVEEAKVNQIESCESPEVEAQVKSVDIETNQGTDVGTSEIFLEKHDIPVDAEQNESPETENSLKIENEQPDVKPEIEIPSENPEESKEEKPELESNVVTEILAISEAETDKPADSVESAETEPIAPTQLEESSPSHSIPSSAETETETISKSEEVTPPNSENPTDNKTKGNKGKSNGKSESVQAKSKSTISAPTPTTPNNKEKKTQSIKPTKSVESRIPSLKKSNQKQRLRSKSVDIG